MTTTSAKYPGTGETLDRVSTASAWVNPGNITANDTSYSTTTASTADGSDYLIARNFGFSVPTNSSITGVVVVINASEHTSGTEAVSARLQDSSATLIGTTKSATFNGTSKTDYTYGTTSDNWTTSLTPDIVNHANFGVRFWFTTAHNIEVNYVTMALTYTTTFTGSGTATCGSITVSGAATHVPRVYDTASGTATLGTVTVTGSGRGYAKYPRSYSAAFTRLWPDGTPGMPYGSFTKTPPAPSTWTASGTATLGTVTVSGTSTVTRTASGTATLGSFTVAGAAKREMRASGTATLGSVTVAGAGSVQRRASGTAVLPSITVAGTGQRVIVGSGAIPLGTITVSGAGTLTHPASGVAVLPAFAVSGTATHVGLQTHTASGTADLGTVAVTGSATHVGRVTHTASGTATLGSFTVAGSASVSHAASGSIVLSALTVAGSARREITGTGQLTLPSVTVAGVASSYALGINVASGTVDLGTLTVAGAASLIHPASGTIDLGTITVSGTSVDETQAAAGPQPAGRPRRRRPRFLVVIDDREFLVEGLAEAQSLLHRAEGLARLAAEKQAQRAEQRALPRARKTGRVEPIRLKAPTIVAPPELAAEVERTQARIRAAFDEQAQAAELRALIAWQSERDEEEALLLSL